MWWRGALISAVRQLRRPGFVAWPNSMVPPSCLRAARTSLPVSYEAARVDATATAPSAALTILVAMASFGSEMNGSSPRRFSAPPKGGSGVSSGSVPLDLNHLGLGGAANRLGLQKRAIKAKLLFGPLWPTVTLYARSWVYGFT